MDAELDQLCDEIENSLVDISISNTSINISNNNNTNNNTSSDGNQMILKESEERERFNVKDTPIGFLLSCDRKVNRDSDSSKSGFYSSDPLSRDRLSKSEGAGSSIASNIFKSGGGKDNLSSSSSTITNQPHVEEYARMCDMLAQRVAQALAMLDALEQQHHMVSEKTESLHGICKKLLAEQNKLDKVVSDIASPLYYLQQLDELGPLLGLPLPSPLNPKPQITNPNARNKQQQHKIPQVDSEEFRSILERLDKCSQFIETHTYFHDYPDYSSKFRQLHIRALSLIRNSIVDAIQNASDSAIPALSASVQGGKNNALRNGMNAANTINSNSGNVNALLYVRFRTLGASLRSSVEELEKRANIAEFSDLLLECQRFYSYQRCRIVNIVIEQAPELSFASQSGSGQTRTNQLDMISKLRIISNYFLQLCLSEYQLYCSFFSPNIVIVKSNDVSDGFDDQSNSAALSSIGGPHSPRARINSQLDSRERPLSPRSSFMMRASAQHRTDTYSALITEICSPLYDIMRPLVVVQNDIDTLCEGVRVLLGEIIEAQILPRGSSATPLHLLLLRIVKDLQERLIHCTSLYIRDEISGFTPLASDLRYPERLVSQASEKDGADADRYFGWYPTLNRTLLLLSKVYRCVDDRVFQDLAQESLSACTSSLIEVSRKISPPSELDSQLFLIKHLLILREQIAPFETEMSVREVNLDFTPTALAFSEFLARRGTLFQLNKSNALVGLVQHGIPAVQEQELNSKKDLENELKRSCEQFIVSTTRAVVEPLLSFLQKADAFTSLSSSSSATMQSPSATTAETIESQQRRRKLNEQEFASKERLSAVIDQCEANITNELASTYAKMKLYLQNSQSESILFKPIQTNIFSTLSKLSRCLETEFDPSISEPLIERLGNIKIILSQMHHTQQQLQQSESSSAAALSSTTSLVVPAISTNLESLTPPASSTTIDLSHSSIEEHQHEHQPPSITIQTSTNEPEEAKIEKLDDNELANV